MKLVQKQFSYAEYYEDEQREFGFIQDVSRSGLKRTMKRNIGRARTKVADKISESIDKDFLKQESLINDVISTGEADAKLRNRLIRRAKKEDNTRVISGKGVFGKGMDSTQKTKVLKEDVGGYVDDVVSGTKDLDMPIEHRNFKKVQNALNSPEENIVVLPSKDPVLLSHELGHIENRLRGNRLQKYINKNANLGNRREDFHGFSSMAKSRSSSSIFPRNQKIQGFEEGDGSIRKAAKRFIDGKLIEREEANASKRGLQMLKDSGASPEQLREAKSSLGKALESYKLTTKASVKSQLRNKIAIPSRRK